MTSSQFSFTLLLEEMKNQPKRNTRKNALYTKKISRRSKKRCLRGTKNRWKEELKDLPKRDSIQ